MEIKRLGTTKLTVKFNTKHTNWDDTQTDFIGIEGEARSRCYSFKIQDAEGINFISENVKMLFKERGSSKVYFSKAIWNPEEEFYYCDIPGNILQKTQIIDIQVCIEDGTTRILTPVITKQVLSSLMSGAAASSGNDIYIDFKNLNDIQKIIDSEEERKKNELERIEESKRIKEMLDTNLDSELKKYAKVEHRHDGQLFQESISNGTSSYQKLATFTFNTGVSVIDYPIAFYVMGRSQRYEKIEMIFKNKTKVSYFTHTLRENEFYLSVNEDGSWDLRAKRIDENRWRTFQIKKIDYHEEVLKIKTYEISDTPSIPDNSITSVLETNNDYTTKTELISNVNLLNAKIDAKNKDCVTKAEYAKDKKRLNSTIAREKKLETLAGLILEELRKQNPDLKPVDISNVLKIEEDEE